MLKEINDVKEDDELFKTHDRIVFDIQNYSMTFLDNIYDETTNISRSVKFNNFTVKNFNFGDRYSNEEIKSNFNILHSESCYSNIFVFRNSMFEIDGLYADKLSGVQSGTLLNIQNYPY